MWILLFLQNATWTVHKRALQVLMTLNFDLLDAVLPFDFWLMPSNKHLLVLQSASE